MYRYFATPGRRNPELIDNRPYQPGVQPKKGSVADAVQSRFFEVIAERPAEYEGWFTDV